ncbi:PEP-CTERM sorting domain-containing protein [Luteolibacter algae]|uniref:PEP-CTERM sorting domain-containing protein n=1 Tax=Luteolibacter algae TaxID=454151 RepID=A0ABW5D4K8_9BACT
MKTKAKGALLSLGVCFVISQSASAVSLVPIYTENFEGGTVGAAINTLNTATGVPWTDSAASNTSVGSIQNTSSAFGAGNKYYQYSRTSGGFNFLGNTQPDPLAGVAMLSFDAYFGTGDWTADGYLRIVAEGDVNGTVGSNTSSSLRYIDIGNTTGLQEGTDFNFDQVVHFDIVANLSGGSFSYDFGSISSTLATGTVDVFVNGTNKLNDAAMNLGGTAGSTGISGFNFWLSSTAGNPANQILIDNVSVSVPEPSSLCLVGLGSLGLLARRRRK